MRARIMKRVDKWWVMLEVGTTTQVAGFFTWQEAMNWTIKELCL